VQTAGLLRGIRSPFVEDIKQLRRVAGNIDANKAELDRQLQVLPIKLNKIGNTATYGSFFNFYLCNFKGTVKLPKALTGKATELPVSYSTGGARCSLG
jgi:phospholipid/cholesterol/gamma-HCH transport system substrate-binding protein